MRYATAVHLCCCGCKREVVTPLSPAQWRLTFDGENVSLHPSIGSGALPSRSHYFLKRGGNVIIPTFALERAQELLFFLKQGVKSGRLAHSIASVSGFADGYQPPRFSDAIRSA